MLYSLTSQPLYMQWMMGTLCGIFALSLLVGMGGAIYRRLRRAHLRPVPALYPRSNFPTRWDIVFTVFFFSYYLIGILGENIAGRNEEVEAVCKNTSPFDLLLYSLIITGLQYVPMALRLAFLPKNKAGAEEGELPPGLPEMPKESKIGKELGMAVLVVLGTVLFSALYEAYGLMDFIVRTTGCPKYQEIVQMLFSKDLSMCVLVYVGAVIIAPIGEECCFRGFLYGGLRKYVGPITAAICASLVFAAVHMSLVAMLPLTVFALLQCWLYEKTKSLRAPIIAHALFNALEATVILLFPPV